MISTNELDKDVDIDLAGVFGSIWRNKFKLLMISLVLTAFAFFVLLFVNPLYRSEAKIFISVTDPVLSSQTTQNNRDLTAMDERGIASKVELLKSRNIADEIIEELKLNKNDEFTSEMDLGPLNFVLEMIGVRTGNGADLTREDRVVEAFFKKLKVNTAQGSRVIVVQFSSENRKLAAKVPTLIVAKYEVLQQKLKSRATPEDLKKLQVEVKNLNREVKLGEAKMAEFRDDQELFQGNNNNTLATQELSELATELGRVRSQRSQAEANAASVSRALTSGALDASSSVLRSPLIQRLRERQVNLRTQLSDLSTTLLPGHPRIKRIQSQIGTLDTQIRNEARKVESSLQQEVRVAQERENDLLQRREELKIEAGRVGKEQVELQFKERELAAKRDLLSQYSIRLKEAEDQQNRAFSPSDAFVFSKAQVPTKAYFPKKGPILAGVFFGTFMLGAMVTLAGSIMSGANAAQSATPVHSAPTQNSVHAQQSAAPSANQQARGPVRQTSAEHVANTPPLAPNMDSITPAKRPPAQPSRKPQVELQGNVSVAAQSLRMLGEGRISVITPDDETGSGAVVLLARSLAQKGASVILIDLTSSGSSGALMLGHGPATGVKDLLSDSVSVADAIHCDGGGTNVHIMPSGMATQNMASHGAERLPSVLDAIQRTYNFVVIDCGDADITGLKHVSDANSVTVVNTYHSDAPGARLAKEMLMRSGFGEPLVIHASRTELAKIHRTVA